MRFRNPAWWCLIVWLAEMAVALPLSFLPQADSVSPWVASLVLWSIPAAVFNAIMLTWRWRTGIRGDTFDRGMRNHLWIAVNAGLACLVVGFATSPVHPSNSLFTLLGALGMPVFVLGYLVVAGVVLVGADTRERWAAEDRQAERRK